MKWKLFILAVLTSYMSYGQVSNFNADTATGCKVWCRYPGDQVKWSGPCKNGLANGSGTVIWSENGVEAERYTGSMKNGKPHGKGIALFPDGRKLSGNFVDGEFLDLDSASLLILRKNTLGLEDQTNLYVSDGNYRSLFYYSIVPQGRIKAVLVLLPGAWETTEHAMSSTREIIERARKEQIAVLIPSVNQHIVLTPFTLEFLNAAFEDAIARYDLPKEGFVLGGFSMGGHLSLRYTELSRENANKTAVTPAAVFNADGPTDLENFYQIWKGLTVENFESNKGEGTYVLRTLEKFTSGTPETARAEYLRYTVFSRQSPDGGNAKYLKNVAVRIYNDADVNWWLENRGQDLYAMNASDQSAMISFLRKQGNKKAEYINTFGKGYRIEGNRHPHSWSIVDPAGLISWIQLVTNGR